MKNLKLLFFMLSISLIFVLAACGSNSQDDGSNIVNENENESEEIIKISLGHIGPDQHSYTLGILEYTEAVEKETNGRVQFEIFGNGQLGGEREIVEQVSFGTLDMTMASSSPSAGFVDSLAVIELPYLFRDADHVYATLDGEVGQDILAEFNKVNIKAISFWERGFSHFGNNNRPIRSAEDLKEMKVRANQNDISIETFRALGADPTPIAFPEVYTSIQQGLVDGLDNSIGVIYSTGLYEVLDYYSLNNFFYGAAVLMINQDKYNSLPEDIQEVIVRLGKEYAHRQREINKEMEAEQLALMRDSGIEVLESNEIDMESFRTELSSLYDKFESRFGDYVERIRNVE